MPVDTTLSSLVINKLTTAQYEQLVENDQINENELYLTTDNSYPTQQDMETALAGKQDVLTAGTGMSIVGNTISTTATTLHKVTNTVVQVSDFVADAQYTGYNYRADVPVTGITANDYPNVIFAVEDCISNNYSRFVESGNGYVSIWCKVLPESAITIPTITYE